MLGVITCFTYLFKNVLTTFSRRIYDVFIRGPIGRINDKLGTVALVDDDTDARGVAILEVVLVVVVLVVIVTSDTGCEDVVAVLIVDFDGVPLVVVGVVL